MSTKVKRRKRKKKNRVDNRTSKILGVMLMLCALYLFIAFFSYIFTWKADQDKVFTLTLSTLFDGSIHVENWLGRLGAVVSNFFMFWGFGLAAFVLVPMLLKSGVLLIKRIPAKTAIVFYRNSFLSICFTSVLLAFLFQQSEFPWGGSFGTNVCIWMASFLGQIGFTILLIFSLFAFFIWRFNPSLEWLTVATPQGFIKLPTSWKLNFRESNGMENKKEAATTLRPKGEGHTLDLELGNDIDDTPSATTTKPSSTHQERSGELKLELPDTMIGEPSTQGAKPFEEIEVEDFGVKSTAAERRKSIEERLSDIDLETNKGKEKINPELSIEEQNLDHAEPFDPREELSRYSYPSTTLLCDYSDQKVEIDRGELEANKDQIIRTLLNYKIEITKIRATIGPTVTLYEIVPAPGVKISKIKNLEDDIALSLAALGIRIIAPIPGKGTIGIEVPNKKKQIVSFKEVIRSDKFQNAKMDLPIALGKTIANEVFVADLAKMPHLLIAGATGQGKSVGINTIIMSLLYKKHPSQVKLVLIDPKKVELFPYGGIEKHFLAFLPNENEPIVTETTKVIYTLNSLCNEMDERYELLKKARARNIKEYNEKFTKRKLNPLNGHKFMPFIVLVIDEFADLIMTAGKEIELPIARIAQLARAVGIHLIIATQRPSVNIITGVIKANFPARIAFKVTSKIDSRTILDVGGADQLIGRGDMLLSVGGNIVRLQCAFVDTPEVEDVIQFIGDQQGFPEPFYLPEYTDDDASSGSKNINLSDLDDQFWDAARLVVANQHGSTSMLQRKLQLGYNRAGRIMDQLEALGVVGEAQGSKPREVLYFGDAELMKLKEHLLNK